MHTTPPTDRIRKDTLLPPTLFNHLMQNLQVLSPKPIISIHLDNLNQHRQADASTGFVNSCSQ